MEYILQVGGGGGTAPCVFCVRDGDLEDPERLFLGLYLNTVAILNRYPYTNGHVLVAPRRHVANLWDLSSEELRELFSLVSIGTRGLAKEYRIGCRGYPRERISSGSGALLAPYLTVRLSRAPCRTGASTLSVRYRNHIRRRNYEAQHEAAPGPLYL